MLTQSPVELGTRQAPDSGMLSHIEPTTQVQLTEERKSQVPGGRHRKTPTAWGLASSQTPFRAPAPRSGLGPAPPGSYMASVCPFRPDLVSLGLELSKPFPAGS